LRTEGSLHRRKSQYCRQFSLRSGKRSEPENARPEKRTNREGHDFQSCRFSAKYSPRLQPLRAAFASKNESGREPLELEQGRTHSSVRVANVGTAVPGLSSGQKVSGRTLKLMSEMGMFRQLMRG
jgi:hypothetical protein